MQLHKDSHLDHGLTNEQMLFILNKFEARDGFFIETFELPENLGTLDCALYGPTVGDAPIPETDVYYAKRGARAWVSRMTRVHPMRKTRTVTVIAGPHDGQPCVLYTVFGGPSTPQEPGDPAAVATSAAFWGEHALADGSKS